MKSTIAFLFVFAIAIGLVGSAYAHKSEVIGDYKVEIGWKNEPPVVGVPNAIEVVATVATDFDKAQAEAEDAAMEGMDHNMEGMDHSMNETSHDDHSSEMGDMTHDEQSAMKEHDDAMALEKEGKYADAAELHHMAAMDLEKAGKYADAAEHHHMAAMDLEKAGKYADAAEHHHMAATDLEKAGKYADAAEHHNLAAEDLKKAGKPTEAIEHEHMAEKDMAKVGTTDEHSGMDHSMNEASHDDHEAGAPAPVGLLKNIEATIELDGKKMPLTLVEDSKFPGVYHAEFTPTVTGFPMVHIAGKIAGEDVEVTFHPEKVEGISVLAPLKQIEMGVASDKVECKEGMDLIHRPSGGNPVCVKHSSVDRLVELGWMK